MEQMTWQAAAAVLVGLFGQLFKAQVWVKNWIPQVIMLAIGTFTYVAFNPPTKDGFSELAQYAILAITSGASVNGVASLIGLHPAIKSQEASK